MSLTSLQFLPFFILFYTTLSSQVKIDSTKVGLVLSGGGAKGISYIGVLRVLEENEIPIDYVVGTSMGGIIRGLYAAGYSPDEMEAIIADPKTNSFIKGENAFGLNQFYKNHLKPANIFTLQFLRTKKLHLRFPFYVYNYFFEESTPQTDSNILKINPNLLSKFYLNNGVHLVYETSLFHICMGLNRYDALVYDKEEYHFFFKIGFSLENKMQLN